MNLHLIYLSIILIFSGFGDRFTNAKPPLITSYAYDNDSTDFIKQAVAFINDVTDASRADKIFALLDKPLDPVSQQYCMEELLKDTAEFSKNELAYLIDKKYPKISLWNEKLFPHCIFLSDTLMKEVLHSSPKVLNYFNKHFKHGFTKFSIPVFLRNNSYCLFYMEHNCEPMCLTGELVLYQKNGKHWEEIKVYCGWIS